MSEYLVRGALLYCDCCTHPRKLNLPVSHGINIDEKAQIFQKDCTEKNIPFLGICKASTPPPNAETVTFEAYKDPSNTVSGPQCCPDIIGDWRNCHEKNGISENELAVTTDSYLVCRCGGLIQPKTSGQELENES